jgi:hypothetical protein
MNRVIYYGELAEEMRYRSSRTADPEKREQLKTAARDFEQIADEIEDEDEAEADG